MREAHYAVGETTHVYGKNIIPLFLNANIFLKKT